MNEEYYSSLDDSALVSLAKTDALALEFLLTKYKSMVRIKAHYFFLAGADSEDVVQEGMIGLYYAVCSFNPDKDASFSTFAELCVTRRMITAVKTSLRKKHNPLNNYVSLSAPSDDEHGSPAEIASDERLTNPESIFIEKETAIAERNRLMSRLSAFEKKVADLYKQGLNYAEIAERLGKSPKSVDNALQRIKNKIHNLH